MDSMTEDAKPDDDAPSDGEDRAMPAAAERALKEAAARRVGYEAEEAARPKEIGGRGGLDPERYGDWEVKGLTSDF